MIRRDDGGDWLIIEQIKHAHLAAEIARAWGNERFEPFTRDRTGPTAGALLHAVTHHDDGWSEWDAAPRLDPRTGMPRDFREMRMQDATAIWTKSIVASGEFHPLSAYAVSRHFCYLAQQVRDGGRQGSDDLAAVRRFLEQQSAVQMGLQEAAGLQGRGEEFDRYREVAYRTVQFFDRVSLWLCCAEEDEPQQMTTPLGELVTFSPSSSPGVTAIGEEAGRLHAATLDLQKFRVTIEPYPLSHLAREFKVEGRRIPTRRYVNETDLRAAWSQASPVQLVWTLCSA